MAQMLMEMEIVIQMRMVIVMELMIVLGIIMMNATYVTGMEYLRFNVIAMAVLWAVMRFVVVD
jgi:hypothetical protein